MNEKKEYYFEDFGVKINAKALDSDTLSLEILKKKSEEKLNPTSGKINCRCGNWSLKGNPTKFSVLRNNLKIAEFEDVEFSYPAWAMSKKEISGKWSSIKHAVGRKSKIFGLGEKTGYLEKSGYCYEMWNTDPGGFYTHNQDPLHISIPFYIVVPMQSNPDKPNITGVYLNQPEKSKFDVKYRTGQKYMGIATRENYLSLQLIYGENINQIIEKFTELTGKPFLPPRWALGYHQSKYGKPENEQEAIKLAKKFRKTEIPCDAFYFDIQHMDGFRIFTWDEERFPSPEEIVEELHDMGFKVVNIVDPGVKVEKGYEVFDSGSKKNVFVKDETDDLFEGIVWPGFCAFPDFFREKVKKWWADQHATLLEKGVDGIWNDMNEPAILFERKEIKEILSSLKNRIDRKNHLSIEDLRQLRTSSKEAPKGLIHENDQGEEISHKKLHNKYALHEAKGTSKAFRKYKPEKRPFVLTRAGFSGIQKYATIWTGDNSSTWEHMKMSIPMILNLGLSGIPHAGADVGGFHGNVEPELLTRWIQLGAFLPFYRNHSSIDTVDQEPWAFEEPWQKINRKYIRFRYKLLPYLYTLSYKAHRKGTPIARPLFLEFPHDKTSYSIQDEFMLGDSLLVSPVLERDTEKTSVYLPYQKDKKSIDWENWWNGEVLSSGYHIVDSPIETIPLFLREDKGVPLSNATSSTEEKPSKLILRGNLESKITIPLYHDDGKTKDYEEGEYFFGEFILKEAEESREANLEIKNDGYKPFWKEIEFKIRRGGSKAKITEFDDNLRKYTLTEI